MRNRFESVSKGSTLGVRGWPLNRGITPTRSNWGTRMSEDNTAEDGFEEESEQPESPPSPASVGGLDGEGGGIAGVVMILAVGVVMFRDEIEAILGI